MSERVRVGVLISGRGSNMAALLYASRAPGCPYEIALVASNDPEAAGLRIARAEIASLGLEPKQRFQRRARAAQGLRILVQLGKAAIARDEGQVGVEDAEALVEQVEAGRDQSVVDHRSAAKASSDARPLGVECSRSSTHGGHEARPHH